MGGLKRGLRTPSPHTLFLLFLFFVLFIYEFGSFNVSFNLRLYFSALSSFLFWQSNDQLTLFIGLESSIMIQWINCSSYSSSSFFSLDFTRELSIFIQLGNCLGREIAHTWISSEPWKRNEEIMLEMLSHIGLGWGLDGYCDI